MTFPTTEDYFLLDTNASANGIGPVLSQVHDGHERVICYASKTLNQAEKRYCTTKRELLAVVYFVKHFNHYLWGRYFTVRPDHSSLTWIKNFKDPIGILARWLSILKTYDFKTEHRGKLNMLMQMLYRVFQYTDAHAKIVLIVQKI